MEAKLGHYVHVIGHNAIGRVYKKHHDFSGIGAPESWLQAQVNIGSIEKARKQPWYNLLMDKGGAITVPEACIIEVLGSMFQAEKAAFNNPWESFYFDDAVGAVENDVWKCAQELRDRIARAFDGKLLEGWALTVDSWTGALHWDHPDSEFTVMASPFWNNEEGVFVEVIGEKDNEPMFAIKIHLTRTNNFEADMAKYLDKMETFFNTFQLQKIKTL